ncbi:hypothetical protein HSBAA_30140 [Vreelandella sulfidaeris]|uniref:Uncharacterized protein n=1 Tax=Vreelandella sulfidaeris TaxID=115553 RepID=A0A455UBN4_9GAMM|nr:hypothetical protein HSBAA_30140 [Halomonas sulfidaeris]
MILGKPIACGDPAKGNALIYIGMEEKNKKNSLIYREGRLYFMSKTSIMLIQSAKGDKHSAA